MSDLSPVPKDLDRIFCTSRTQLPLFFLKD